LGRLDVGWEKVACWSTKAAISLKCVEIEVGNVTMEGLQELTNALWNSTIPTSYGLLFPRLGFATPKTSIAIISRMGKATNFKFSWYIHRVYRNKSPFKILEKRERGPIQGLPNFCGHPNYLRNG